MFKSGLALFILTLLTGCLPQAKQQSCGAGNVFNSTSRTCIPISSGGQTSGVSIAGRSPALSNFTVSTNSATVLNFAVSINNPLNQGYDIQWKLYSPSGTLSPNLAFPTLGAVSFTPQNAFQGATGLWTLAAEIVSVPGNVLITQTQWFLSVVNANTPTLTKISGSPLSVATSPAAVNYGVTVSNPAGSPTVVVWYYNGVQESTVMASNGSVAYSNSKLFFSPANNILNDNPPLLSGPAPTQMEGIENLEQRFFSDEVSFQAARSMEVEPEDPPKSPRKTRLKANNDGTVSETD